MGSHQQHTDSLEQALTLVSRPGGIEDFRMSSRSIAQNRLPADVLFEIFGTSQASSESDLFRLAHVCLAWRHVIHEHSAFWSTIPLDLGKRDQGEKAAFWVDRAGERLLSIKIEDTSRPQNNDGDRLLSDAPLVHLGVILRSFMDRWTSFIVSASPSKMDTILRLCSGFTPKLTNIKITVVADDPHVMTPLIVPFSLPSDHGSSEIVVSTTRCLPTFWSIGRNITNLNIDCYAPDFQDTLELLRACPNLMWCSLHIPDSEGDLPPAWTKVQLPHLIGLHMLFFYDTLGRLLDALEVPLLQCLIVQQFSWDEAAVQAFWSFFRRCRNLEKIYLHDDDHNDEHMEHGFGEAPITLGSVIDLDVHGNYIAASLFRKLSFPNLKKLELQNLPFDIFHSYASLAMHLTEISLFDIFDIPDVRTPTLLLPSLTALTLRQSSEVLDFLTAPRLESLSVRCDYDKATAQHLGKSLPQFLRRQRPALRSLGLFGWDASDEEMIGLMKEAPSLKKLALHGCSVSDDVLHALVVPLSTSTSVDAGPEQEISTRADGSCLLPELTAVILSNNPHITPLGVIEFLKSRNSRSSSARPPPHVEAEIIFRGSIRAELTRDEYDTIQSYGGISLGVQFAPRCEGPE
ncbi:hypothetical protein BOTBODRAFT_144748 [Botryobasidium botryosum FD-172 SS1]|uniref:F-box domain-containing protein n=1 Tax=Botryobasidium botryosum (strain FD-172 SS1) TaxID=930990 RepID=A0A067MWS7_BOTB1|nr:hypothetical protein BOTBODRAFT_144748 [Botryobasidium botryosum FD-172 SS1]